MNEFKRKILKLFVISTLTIFSTNCFAMKKNLGNIIKNESSNQSNNEYLNKKTKSENKDEKKDKDKKNDIPRKSYNKKIFNFEKIPSNKIKNNNNNHIIINLNEEENDKYLNKKAELENKDERKNKDNKSSISLISYNRKDSYDFVETPVNKIKNNNNMIINLNKDEKKR